MGPLLGEVGIFDYLAALGGGSTFLTSYIILFYIFCYNFLGLFTFACDILV
jgi:hypothetical protein